MNKQQVLNCLQALIDIESGEVKKDRRHFPRDFEDKARAEGRKSAFEEASELVQRIGRREV